MIVAARLLTVAFCGVFACLFSGCTTGGGPTPPSDKYIVSVRRSQFYKYGPAQAFGADFALNVGQRVTMLKREFGYSKVMLADGTTGFMATEELQPAPPDPPAPKPSRTASRGWFSSGKPKRSNVLPTPTDPLFDVNDVPLPLPDEAAAPSPSIPATPSQPESQQPKPDPNFRF